MAFIELTPADQKGELVPGDPVLLNTDNICRVRSVNVSASQPPVTTIRTTDGSDTWVMESYEKVKQNIAAKEAL